MLEGTPSQESMIKMNLQLFAEGGPPPSDPPSAQTPSDPPPANPQPADPLPPQDGQKIKVKFNHEEREIPYEEAVQLAQKGMNYDKAVERARQEARDAWITEQGYTWNGKPVTTEADYRSALQEAEMREQLKNKELPEEVVNELVESRKFREEAKAERQTKAQQDKQQQDYMAFVTAYPDVKPDTIPESVWVEVNKGKSLVDAYEKHENASLKTKLAEYEAKFKALETNEKNASSSPGSLSGNSANSGQYFTAEQVKAMTPAQVKHHYSSIEESMKKW